MTLEQAAHVLEEYPSAGSADRARGVEPLTRYTQFHGRPCQRWRWELVGESTIRADVLGHGVCPTAGLHRGLYLAQYAAIVRPDEEKFSRPGRCWLS